MQHGRCADNTNNLVNPSPLVLPTCSWSASTARSGALPSRFCPAAMFMGSKELLKKQAPSGRLLCRHTVAPLHTCVDRGQSPKPAKSSTRRHGARARSAARPTLCAVSVRACVRVRACACACLCMCVCTFRIKVRVLHIHSQFELDALTLCACARFTTNLHVCVCVCVPVSAFHPTCISRMGPGAGRGKGHMGQGKGVTAALPSQSNTGL